MSIDAEKLANVEWEPAEQIEGEAVYLRERVRALEDELLAIKLSRSYRVTQRLLRSRYGRLLHRVAQILIPDQDGIVQQRPRRNTPVSLWSLVRRGAPQPLPATTSPPADGPASVVVAPPTFSPEEQTWLEHVTAHRPAAIAVLNPEWRGVRRSTIELFPYHRFIDDDLDATRAEHQARLLLESGCERIVISAFPDSYIHLVRSLHRLAPRLKIFSFWHGNFTQLHEDHEWNVFRLVEQLCREGVIYKWGFTQQGMAQVMAATGLRTAFVMNMVRQIPMAPAPPPKGGPYLGIWAIEPIWRKSPYATLAAVRMIAGACVFGSGCHPRSVEFARLLDLNARLRSAPIPQSQMPEVLARMHLNLYITLSECTPMLPLESLSVGVPCLIGPTSHLFEDDEYLYARLVVPSPDRALVIARHIEQALAERDQIVAAYIRYAPGYNARALQSVRDFLELSAHEPI
jgi:hypothetical protein